MKKIRSHNPMFLVLSIVVPWRFINTYYYLTKETLYISRYYANEKSRSFKRELVKITIKEIQKIGFGGDFGIHSIEPIYGKYQSQEIIFVLKNGTKIGWNVKYYTKKQLVELFKFRLVEKNIIFGSRLKNILKL